jgi:Low psii accumulation1 / Rep27
MSNPSPKRPNALQQSDPEKYARLLAESKAPYRGLRKFVYVAFGMSGAIGGFVFLFRVLAGRDLETTLPNLALQIGVVALMVWLFRIDGKGTSE